MNKKPIVVAVLFGGCSPEYPVSLQSAYAVICHMDREKYKPVPIGITKNGKWFYFEGAPEKILQDTWHDPACCIPIGLSPDRLGHALFKFSRGKNEKLEKLYIDAVFPVLHGKNGEDGTVQGIFELAGIPLVGCGTLSSSLCMDKDRAHRLVSSAGIRVPRSFVLEKDVRFALVLSCAGKIGYPLFVKPLKAGSSFGITKVWEESALSNAVESAFLYDDHIILEENIPGFEVGCAIVGNTRLTVGEVDEIELSDGFFNYTEKYTLKTSAIHVPARISPDMAQRIKQTAKTIYQTLDCRGFARVDLFLTPSGELVFNEVNTIPGFTEHSRFPNMFKAAGWSFGQVISAIMETAVQNES